VTFSDDVLQRNPELAAALPRRRNKYNAVTVTDDGYTFASKKEHSRYVYLKTLAEAHAISHLEVHPAWELVVKGQLIGRYTADFSYREGRRYIVEDVKSKATKTRDYVLRKKLMKALHGIEIQEV
jgi:hypothetical protein